MMFYDVGLKFHNFVTSTDVIEHILPYNSSIERFSAPSEMIAPNEPLDYEKVICLGPSAEPLGGLTERFSSGTPVSFNITFISGCIVNTTNNHPTPFM